ncbi:MAG TPA: SDR family NAD(P)-dependent oxidoreductase [Acidimicrobiia bacterium]|jgi:NAD(P)-dependent dehydrogenase (short-subunit alcohol dehydrogenase family)
MRFAGKSVLITGGGSGIGAAAARLFATEGAAVALAARSVDKIEALADEITAAGAVASAYRCDVTVPQDCAAVVSSVVADLGSLDVVFNNAGIIFRERTVPETSVDEWDATFDVNVRGTFLVSRAAIPVMVGGGGGVIVNNASYFGLVGGRGTAAYSASKAAVVLLTKSMALDHARQGIRVNCVCAGSVDTPMLRNEMDEMGGAEQVRHIFEEKHPIGRIASPDEIAKAVLFLASDDASFVTGVALPVDGGITAA